MLSPCATPLCGGGCFSKCYSLTKCKKHRNQFYHLFLMWKSGNLLGLSFNFSFIKKDNRIDPYYWWAANSPFHLPDKLYLYPWNQCWWPLWGQRVQSITHIPRCGGTRPRSPSCFHSPTTNKGSFHGLFSATFFSEFLLFLLVTLLLKMAPKVPLNAVWCSQACKGCDALHRENTWYISFVQSWIRHAVGHEFGVHESTVYIK